MPQVRRRYYTWLIRAYIKKWKRTILTSLFFGVIVFGVFITLFNIFLRPQLEKKVQKIGYWGTYETADLPQDIVADLSFGLTKIDKNGKVIPAAAKSWEIKNNGKLYIFYLNKKLVYHNGQSLSADLVSLNFKDIEKKIINSETISYTLKSPYSPFLTSVSKPLFIEGSKGLGAYKLSNIDLNGGFVRSVVLQNVMDGRIKKMLYFYPTQSALKLAFVMGEIDTIAGVDDITVLKSSFNDWPRTTIKRRTDKNTIVSLFYNTQDSTLSNKKVRQALNYALPSKYLLGERVYSPIRPDSEYYYKASESIPTGKDFAQAILASKDIVIERDIIISTTPEFEKTAQIIQDAWSEVGIKSKVQIVSSIPSSFQVFLYSFKVPADPDQYTLWHSTGVNNISKYKNLRIDKLLEDGRSTADISIRKSLYDDFQKYLIDDVPASFLYFPYQYTVKRS